MNSNTHFSLTTFTDTTKKVCTSSAISIFLIVLLLDLFQLEQKKS